MHLRRLNADLHRDIGYFLSGLIVVYALSGIALNHIGDWNPDFVVHKQTLKLERRYTAAELTPALLAELSARVGEDAPKVHDFPTPHHVKLYYEHATLLLDLTAQTGAYESLRRRPLFYHFNVLHRNSLKGWRWAADVFGALLIVLTVTGWFILRGRAGLGGRGKWLIAAGLLPPVLGLLLFSLLQS